MDKLDLELLSHGTKVILVANSLPTLNDVTHEELNVYCSKAAQHCDIIKNALTEGQTVRSDGTCRPVDHRRNGTRGTYKSARQVHRRLC
ncbi:unnamed protein product [Acanthoscelides obtectus]|uniref:Uncharacterized protein n=1 Tax=Acanthoscelides obtectus TaxID=200917 RepID=A0A9P0LZ69_ACAOB|nr:unnamed protein product [Acanthoscelides obtectus]CAK1644059.1 Pantothenate kinase 2 [Acanthoscelides obtectus]